MFMSMNNMYYFSHVIRIILVPDSYKKLTFAAPATEKLSKDAF